MNTTQPKLSIITICLNDKGGLVKTMESVFAQDFPYFEYIVIDGESNDGSKEYVIENSKKLHYWISEKDNGIYDAMNKGIKQAHGDYLLFLNAGDVLAHSKVISAFFDTPQSTGLVYGNILFDDGTSKLQLFKQPAQLSFDYLMVASPQHPATFIRRTLFEEYGLYDTTFRIAADYDFFLRILLKYETSSNYINETVCIFDRSGISSLEKFKNIEIAERKRAQESNIPKLVISYYNELATNYTLQLHKRALKTPFWGNCTKIYFKLVDLFI